MDMPETETLPTAIEKLRQVYEKTEAIRKLTIATHHDFLDKYARDAFDIYKHDFSNTVAPFHGAILHFSINDIDNADDKQYLYETLVDAIDEINNRPIKRKWVDTGLRGYTSTVAPLIDALNTQLPELSDDESHIANDLLKALSDIESNTVDLVAALQRVTTLLEADMPQSPQSQIRGTQQTRLHEKQGPFLN